MAFTIVGFGSIAFRPRRQLYLCSCSGSRSSTPRRARREFLQVGLASVGAVILVPSQQSTAQALDEVSGVRELPSSAASISSEDSSSLTSSFVEYRGPSSLNFTFSYPAGWYVTKKPIKTHISEVIVSSKEKGGLSAGLVVDMVKLDKIEKFGSAQSVAEKVVALERKKDSVNTADVLMTDTVSFDGLTYYILDYVVDSSRGKKRFLAKATVSKGQLYVFTAQAKAVDFEGLTSATLQQMVKSFHVLPQVA